VFVCEGRYEIEPEQERGKISKQEQEQVRVEVGGFWGKIICRVMLVIR
jgi:hypothetical protein